MSLQESGICRPPGPPPQHQHCHNRGVDSRVPTPSRQHYQVSPPLPPANSTPTSVITPNLPISQASCAIGSYNGSSRGASLSGVSSLATASVGGSINRWQSGREPVSNTTASGVTSATSQLNSLLLPDRVASRGYKEGSTKSQSIIGKMSYYAQPEMEQCPAFSSSSSLFSSRSQRAGESVITSRISNPLPSSLTTYCADSRPTLCAAPETPNPALSSEGRCHPESISPRTHSQSAAPSLPRSIEETLDDLDAELEGDVQAEERKEEDREEQERKMREEERWKRELEIRQKQDEEKRRKELEKAEEEQKNRELERQEKERKRRQEEEEEKRRKEAERLEEERKKREWEKQEWERKRKEWERLEDERKKQEAERQEQERKKMEEKQKQRDEERRRRMEQNKEGQLCSAKGKEQTATEKRERLLSGNNNTTPPPPRLSAITAPLSGSSPPTSQASPPYPWLSRGGILPSPPVQTTNSTTSVERLRPPPLTPQTEYAREKQRQRELSSNNGRMTFSPLSTQNTSGMNQLVYPNKPPAMQAAPDQSKDSVRERGSGQHSLPTMALRDPPKLYQAFSREHPPPPLLSSNTTRGLLTMQMTGSSLENANSCGTDSDSAQFEEEPSELSTLLPDGLANIMAMLDESIKKEEEMYNNEKTGPRDLLENVSSGLQPIKSYLCAPDLIPATKHQPNQEDFGCNLHASPPVLSRQGSLASPCSRTSSLNEEEEDYLKTSPSVVFKPKQSVELTVGNTNYRHSDLAKLYGLPEQMKNEADEEYDDDSETPSCSPPPQRPHLHQTGVNSMFKSLATVLESQKYTYRGGPFGRPPPSALGGVKYSSSLSLGPDICHQHGGSPTSDSTNPPVSPALPPFRSSNSLLEDKKLKLEDDIGSTDVWGDDDTAQERVNTNKDSNLTINPVKVVEEEQLLMTISESSLAELGKSCEVILSRHSLPTKSITDKSENHGKVEDRHKAEKVKEHREKDRNRGKEKKKKHGHSHSSCRKHEERKKKHRDKREMALSPSSTHSSSGHKRHKDGKNHKEKDRRILGDLNLHSKEGSDKNWSHHNADKRKHKMVSAASSTSAEEHAECYSKNKNGSEPGSSIGSTDFLKLKALPPKELKIRLIKVESGDRETFIASEVEEKRIPLKEISIMNTASEIIRSCK